MTIILLISLLCLPGIALAADLWIGIDFSGSNPLLSHQAYADRAALYLQHQILPMEEGDTVTILGFGARYLGDNLTQRSVTIDRRLRAPSVAQMAAEFVRKLPESDAVRQGQSSIVDLLELTYGFDCAAGDQLILLTDGLESSEATKASDLLAGESLPAPDRDLAGCTVTMYGLGAGMRGQHAKTLRRAWSDWMKQAGATFEAVIL